MAADVNQLAERLGSRRRRLLRKKAEHREDGTAYNLHHDNNSQRL
jgi:hypothetical protein